MAKALLLLKQTNKSIINVKQQLGREHLDGGLEAGWQLPPLGDAGLKILLLSKAHSCILQQPAARGFQALLRL